MFSRSGNAFAAVDTTPRFVYVILTIIFIICASSLSVTSIVISNKFSNDECIGAYNGISFSYGVWLDVNGWTGLAMVCFIVIFGTLYKILQRTNERISNIIGTIGLGGIIFYAIFQFIWYIIGAVLYFVEVYSTCAKGTPLYDFGLTLFVIHTIITICVIAYLNESSRPNRPT